MSIAVGLMSILVLIIVLPFHYAIANEFNAFENKEMRIRFNYPPDWKFGFAGIMPESCQYLSCSLELIRRDNASFGNEYGDSGGLRITMVPIDSSGCNCGSLDEYVKWRYNTLTDDRGFVFINDNQTSVADYPARLVNYNTSYVGSFSFIYPSSSFTVSEVFTKTDNAFYVFTFFGLGGYSVLQKDFDSVLKSVQFLTTDMKKPSFLK